MSGHHRSFGFAENDCQTGARALVLVHRNGGLEFRLTDQLEPLRVHLATTINDEFFVFRVHVAAVGRCPEYGAYTIVNVFFSEREPRRLHKMTERTGPMPPPPPPPWDVRPITAPSAIRRVSPATRQCCQQNKQKIPSAYQKKKNETFRKIRIRRFPSAELRYASPIKTRPQTEDRFPP